MLIVDEFGGWGFFQELLAVLRQAADKHKTNIAAVAVRYILQKPGVAAAIVGARHTDYLADTLRIFQFALDDKDLAAIERVAQKANGPAGDVYALERIKGGKHQAIMKYNLSKA
jgi:aryl-alcohol dehydrogenase-like predicted oxidoreductase